MDSSSHDGDRLRARSLASLIVALCGGTAVLVGGKIGRAHV